LRTVPGTLLRIAVTFLAVCLGWVFFRATTFSISWTMLRHLVPGHAGMPAPLTASSFWALMFLVAVCHLVALRGLWNRLALRLPEPVLGAAYAAVLTLALVLTPGTGKAFIYFQF
jgi:alginate O-acetyltransferase complex protein AlgI